MSLGSFASFVHQLEPLGAQRLQLVQAPVIGAARGLLEIFERDRVEVVVGERDEAEAEAPQLDDLLDHGIDAALARLLAVGLPDRTERAVLRAAAHGLHRCPHVAIGRQQIPARLQEMLGVDFSALVHLVEIAVEAAFDGLAPREVAIALDDGVAAAEVQGFVRVQRGVDAAVDDERTAVARDPADLVSAQGIARVDADADDVARRNRGRVELLEGLVGDERVAVFRGGGCR